MSCSGSTFLDAFGSWVGPLHVESGGWCRPGTVTVMRWRGWALSQRLFSPAVGAQRTTSNRVLRRSPLLRPRLSSGCAPDRLARCVPGLANVDENLFGEVTVYKPFAGFDALPPSAAREAAPQQCRYLPRFGAKDSPEGVEAMRLTFSRE